jgi:ankyrin repeat protein
MTTALLTALSDVPGKVCPTDEQQRVCFAVTSKDVDALRALIDAGADVQTPFDCFDDDKAPRRFNPLQWAAYYDVVAVVRLLIDHGRVPVDSCSRDEPSTPLVLGAAVGSCDSSRFLVERGASLASTNPSGRCLVEIAHFNLADLMLAAIAADPSMLTRAISDTFVKGLLRSERAEATVLLDRVIASGHVLPPAAVDIASVGHIDTVALLLRLGFVPTVDAINTAAKRCDLAKVELLLLHGCPLTGDPLHNDSPLLLAIESGHIDIARRLRDAGATTFARFASNGVFHRAVRAPNPLEMLEFVLRLDGDLGVSVNDRDYQNRTPLAQLCSRWADLSFAELTAVCERLVAAGATVTEVDYRGATALHYGAESANTALMKLLLERGSDINARDQSGCTPISRLLSETRGDTVVRAEAAEWLAQQPGTELPIDMLRRAMWSTCGSRQVGVVRFLLQHGLEINSRVVFGTPLEEAIGGDSPDIVRLLLSLGARVGADSPIHVAMARQRARSLCVLLASGFGVGASDWEPMQKAHDSAGDLWACLVALMVDAVPRATVFANASFFVAACWWGLPVDDELLPATQTNAFAMARLRVEKQYASLLAWVATEKLKLINPRAVEICIALQPLELPVLQTVLILDEACPLAPYVTMLSKWKLAAKVKHAKH